MLVMGLDTALQRCSVAILRDGAVIADQKLDMARGHAETIAPMTVAALRDADVMMADIDRVGVVNGPGGFAGVRVAIAFARGLAIGTKIELISVTSLAAIAANTMEMPEGGLIASVIDARRGQVYAGLYTPSGAVRVAPFVAAPEQALKLLADGSAGHPVSVIGSGAGLLSLLPKAWSLSDGAPQIDAKNVARIAAAASPEKMVSPLYLRPPDAKPAKPGAFTQRSS